MRDEINDLFRSYESETNAALAGQPDIEALSDLYADVFVAAAPAGVVTGQKDQEFRAMLASGLAHNREIGTRRMDVEEVRVEPVDALHALAHVRWRATYDVGGDRKTIGFTNAYLTRVENGRAKVFGWITGDEQAELRKHGIID